MPRRLLPALCVTALTTASVVVAATPARAHHRASYRACVVADYGAWLHPHRCHHNRCWMPVRWGRAFRVERQVGGYLLVRNQEARGWVDLGALRLAPQAYCRAAGL